MPQVLERPGVEAVSYTSEEVWTRYVQKLLKEGKEYDAQHPSIPWDEVWNRIKARHPCVIHASNV